MSVIIALLAHEPGPAHLRFPKNACSNQGILLSLKMDFKENFKKPPPSKVSISNGLIIHVEILNCCLGSCNVEFQAWHTHPATERIWLGLARSRTCSPTETFLTRRAASATGDLGRFGNGKKMVVSRLIVAMKGVIDIWFCLG